MAHAGFNDIEQCAKSKPGRQLAKDQAVEVPRLLSRHSIIYRQSNIFFIFYPVLSMEYCPVDTKTVAGQHCVKHIFSFIDFQWNFAQLTQKQWQTTLYETFFSFMALLHAFWALTLIARSRSRRSRNLNWRSLQRPRQEWASWGPAKGKQKKKSRKEIKE